MILISLCHVFGLCHSFKDCALSPSLLFQEHYPQHLMQKTDSFEKALLLERLKAGGEGDDRGWDGWMASPTQWTWVWVNSGSWWWTRRSGVLQCMRLQRIGHNWVTELNSTESPTHPFVFCWGWYLRWFWPFWWVAEFPGSLLCINVLKLMLDFSSVISFMSI